MTDARISPAPESAEEAAALAVAGEAPAQAGLATLSRGYRRYVMVLLLLGCTLNFLDRGVINILAEPIKVELHLKNWQLGMLTGFYFALFYSVLSLPIGRWADKGSRSQVIAICIGAWSLLTVACGFARSYFQLAVFRLLLGVGEAGGSPTSQALIADYTPQSRRAGAIAFYTLGIPIGSLIGLAFGGLVLDRYGWRIAFIVAGAPGLLVAAVAGLTLREPKVAADGRPVQPRSAPDFWPALREIFSKRSFVLLTAGGALVSFVNYANSAWIPSFFFRDHAPEIATLAHATSGALGIKLGPAGFIGPVLGVASGVAGIFGTLAGGWLTDWQARRSLTAYIWVQVLFTLLRLPFQALAMLSPSVAVSVAALFCQAICTGVAGAPAYASIQGLVQPRVRATAAAVFLLGLNLIGLGLGPVLVGAATDVLAAHGLGEGEGLRWAMLTAGEVVLVAATVFLAAAGRTFTRDTVS
jgi:MFS family permease